MLLAGHPYSKIRPWAQRVTVADALGTAVASFGLQLARVSVPYDGRAH